MNRHQLRQLTQLVTTAAAGLIPFDADPEARDHHGNRAQDREATLDRALTAVEQAGRMAGQIRANAAESGEVLNRLSQLP